MAASVCVINLYGPSKTGVVFWCPVPMDTQHFTDSARLSQFGDQMSLASAQTSWIGLLAPKAPSTYFEPSIVTGAKNVVAAEVARAAWQMVAETGIASRL